MKRRNLLAAVLSFSLVIGMSAPVDLAQESKKTQTAVSMRIRPVRRQSMAIFQFVGNY